jgi:hypothetical protein
MALKRPLEHIILYPKSTKTLTCFYPTKGSMLIILTKMKVLITYYQILLTLQTFLSLKVNEVNPERFYRETFRNKLTRPITFC